METDSYDILSGFDSLRPYQRTVIEDLLTDFFEMNDLLAISLIEEQVMSCRHCGGTSFVKNGRTNGSQRYKCRHCGTTQFKDANTPLYNLKLKDKWIDFLYVMFNNDYPASCGEISKYLEISVKTVHAWRHKLLSSLIKAVPVEIDQEVEIDEIYLPLCVKGVIGKEKYDEYYGDEDKRNKASELRTREIHMLEAKYQSVFLCWHNRNGDFNFSPIKMVKSGCVSKEDLKRVMPSGTLINKTVITDKERSLISYFSDFKNITHKTFKSSDIKNGIVEEHDVHNNHINNTMMLLKRWLKRFFGVSTKYMANYLSWFRFSKLFQKFQWRKMAEISVTNRSSYPDYLNIFDAYKEFIYA